MSRIAKRPINIPKGVDVTIEGQTIKVKGPKGLLTYEISRLVSLQKDGETLTVSEKKQEAEQAVKLRNKQTVGALLGTTNVNVSNMIQGVSEGFEKKLILIGVGYRAQVEGKKLNLTLGFSHPLAFEIPEGITIETPTPTEIIIRGPDKQLVGQVAANVREKRPVEPYKGKGVRYENERVILKETKKA